MNPRDKTEIAKSFQLLMRFIADQAVEIETIRFFLREKGVTNEDYDLVRSDLKKRWNAAVRPQIEKIKERLQSEELRKLLEEYEGPKQ